MEFLNPFKKPTTKLTTPIETPQVKIEEAPEIIPIYHHTDKEFDDFNTWHRGIFFTENPKGVEGNPSKAKGVVIKRYIDLSKLRLGGFNEELKIAGMTLERKIDWLKKHGFDGLARKGVTHDGNEMHYWILYPDKVAIDEDQALLIPEKSPEPKLSRLDEFKERWLQ